MKLTRFILILLIILLSIVLSSTTFAKNVILNGGLLWLNPAGSSAFIGETQDIAIQLDNVTNVYGAAIALSFDPTILAVVDADPGTPEVEIFTGSCPAPDFVVWNEADNNLGTIHYDLTQLNPTPPCDGGTVATIRFECLAEGTGQITFTDSLIADPDGLEIPAITQDASLTCEAPFSIYLPFVLNQE
jgi:hypothetical protein